MSATVYAQPSATTPQQEALDAFKACYGSDWNHQVRPETGFVSLLMGGRIELPGALEDPVATAQRFLEANQALLGFDRPEDTLAYDRTTGLSSGGRVVSFNQLYKNVPVWQHRALVCFTEEGVLNYLSSGIWPIADIDVKPRITATQAERIIARSEGDEDVKAKRPAELVLLARGEGVLAWYSISDVGSPQLPIRHFVDAKSGAIIERTELTHYRQEPPRQRTPVDPETVPPPLDLGGVADPCDHWWNWVGPALDVVFTPEYPAGDPYAMNIRVGATSWDAIQDGNQALEVYGADIHLLPGISWDIEIDWSLWTWDSYRERVDTGPGPDDFEGGHWDVLFATVNPTDNFWNLTAGEGVAERSCDFALEWSDSIGPGYLLTAGGRDWGDDNLCTQSDSDNIYISEQDLTKSLVLSLGLDTGRTGEIDGYYPSWGEFDVRITAPSHYFNPNPMIALNDSTLVDDNDSNAAVTIGGYDTLGGVLPNLNPPDPALGYVLEGDYCRIVELGAPTILTPTSHDGQFPYLRGCDQFEAVNCYIHITQFQLYLQSLGFTGANSVNARPIEVDPHFTDLPNAAYISDGNGTGKLVFGTGGVDTAEDGDVIIHEYAHACLDYRRPNWSTGSESNDPFTVNETEALSEACADFLAANYFNAGSGDISVAAVGEWVAENPQGLRTCDLDWVYPHDMANQNNHDAGQVFSRFLWDLRGSLGGDRVVQIILDALPLMNNDINHYFSSMVSYMSHASINSSGSTAEAMTITNAALDRGILRAIEISAVDVAGNPLPGNVVAIPTPTDWLGRGGGLVPLERIYPWGMNIAISAPAIDADGRALAAWRVNDYLWQHFGSTTVTYRIDEVAQHHVQILYGAVAGDLNGDGSVNGTDLSLLLGGWGTPYGDIDGDGTTNGVDLSLLLGNWGT